MIVDYGRIDSENEAVCYTLKTLLMIALFCLCFIVYWNVRKQIWCFKCTLRTCLLFSTKNSSE